MNLVVSKYDHQPHDRVARSRQIGNSCEKYVLDIEQQNHVRCMHLVMRYEKTVSQDLSSCDLKSSCRLSRLLDLHNYTKAVFQKPSFSYSNHCMQENSSLLMICKIT